MVDCFWGGGVGESFPLADSVMDVARLTSPAIGSGLESVLPAMFGIPMLTVSDWVIVSAMETTGLSQG